MRSTRRRRRGVAKVLAAQTARASRRPDTANDESTASGTSSAPPVPATAAPVQASVTASVGTSVGASVGTPSVLHKTKLCKFHAQGLCNKGEGCTFAHNKASLMPTLDLSRTKMCPLLGACQDPSCRFAHNRKELRRMPPKLRRVRGVPPRPAESSIADEATGTILVSVKLCLDELCAPATIANRSSPACSRSCSPVSSAGSTDGSSLWDGEDHHNAGSNVATDVELSPTYRQTDELVVKRLARLLPHVEVPSRVRNTFLEFTTREACSLRRSNSFH